MKRSRIFAGISAIVLALTGVVATKATSKFVIYYYQASSSNCAQVDTICQGGSNACTVTIGSKTYNVFTMKISASQCQTLATKP